MNGEWRYIVLLGYMTVILVRITQLENKINEVYSTTHGVSIDTWKTEARVKSIIRKANIEDPIKNK